MKILFTSDRQPSGLSFTLNHSGKMRGIQSLSTSALNNERCKKNAAVKGSICEHCYATRIIERYKHSMNAPLIKNAKILSEVIDTNLLPVTPVTYFRFQAFGDLSSVNEVINYFNLCDKNPQTKFALWTKNPDYISKAIRSGYNKPENLQIVLSSLFLNKARKTNYNFVDKVFTVYDNDTIEEKKININCGSNSCFICHRCYEKKEGIEYINEKLKK